MKKLNAVLALALSLMLALCACAPAAAPAPEATEAVAAEPTAAPAEPTVAPAEPTAAPEPAPLYTAGTYTATAVGRNATITSTIPPALSRVLPEASSSTALMRANLGKLR